MISPYCPVRLGQTRQRSASDHRAGSCKHHLPATHQLSTASAFGRLMTPPQICRSVATVLFVDKEAAGYVISFMTSFTGTAIVTVVVDCWAGVSMPVLRSVCGLDLSICAASERSLRAPALRGIPPRSLVYEILRPPLQSPVATVRRGNVLWTRPLQGSPAPAGLETTDRTHRHTRAAALRLRRPGTSRAHTRRSGARCQPFLASVRAGTPGCDSEHRCRRSWSWPVSWARTARGRLVRMVMMQELLPGGRGKQQGAAQGTAAGSHG